MKTALQWRRVLTLLLLSICIMTSAKSARGGDRVWAELCCEEHDASEVGRREQIQRKTKPESTPISRPQPDGTTKRCYALVEFMLAMLLSFIGGFLIRPTFMTPQPDKTKVENEVKALFKDRIDLANLHGLGTCAKLLETARDLILAKLKSLKVIN
jgi:hypothetical protein